MAPACSLSRSYNDHIVCRGSSQALAVAFGKKRRALAQKAKEAAAKESELKGRQDELKAQAAACENEREQLLSKKQKLEEVLAKAKVDLAEVTEQLNSKQPEWDSIVSETQTVENNLRAQLRCKQKAERDRQQMVAWAEAAERSQQATIPAERRRDGHHRECRHRCRHAGQCKFHLALCVTPLVRRVSIVLTGFLFRLSSQVHFRDASDEDKMGLALIALSKSKGFKYVKPESVDALKAVFCLDKIRLVAVLKYTLYACYDAQYTRQDIKAP
eukprot:TRINITY_DN727_c0_g1_i4.p1 TRINITY_DN727_c0_g1~~TRINITY_DN727_c0_g1_i4.p1  ORF type:complete len:272 (-),score=36.93 TRINITY_DN727_c0_g1_i4:1032-1847(-)